MHIDHIRCAMRPLYLFFIEFVAVFVSAASVYGRTSDSKAWAEFRKLHPFSFQCVALQHYGDSTAIIVSEPPQKVSYEDINAVFNRYGARANVYKQKTGYDGWFKDVGGTFAFASEQSFKDFTSELFMLLYSSAYKPYYIELAKRQPHACYFSANLNLSVSAAELEKWFITDGELFDTDEGPKRLKDILEAKQMPAESVICSSTPGFVIWVLPGRHIFDLSVGKWKSDFRRFALDADLILGAVGRPGGRVAIIGRERQVPVSVLPPLLAETVSMLATTRNTSLAQSYERYAVFAGKTSKGEDVAPIYLSEELKNTEYGNLLNVTDQMLKSWCENGGIEYVDFPYPKPVDWAFNKGVLKDLGQSTITYNWNTAGAGYTIESAGGLDVYALNRTGSLPVSLIPSGMEGKISDAVFDAEELAYDFFSGLSNIELTRVVQYAALYQIFVHYFSDKNVLMFQDLLKMRFDNKNNFQSRPVEKLATYVEALLRYAASPGDNSSRELYDKGLRRYLERVKSISAEAMLDSLSKEDPDFMSYHRLNNDIDDEIIYERLSRQLAEKDYKSYVDKYAAKVASYLSEKGITADKYKKSAEVIVNPRIVNERYNSTAIKFEAEWRASNPQFDMKLKTYENIYAEYESSVDSYNRKVDSINVHKAAISPLTLNLERIQIDFLQGSLNKLQKEIEKIIAERKTKLDKQLEPIKELLLLCPDEDVVNSLGALNWLLTPHEGFGEPFGDFYAVNFADDAARWLKTPSIVCSYNGTGYGGHNLDAKISDIKTVKNVKKGFARVTTDSYGVRKINVGAADRSRITPGLLRTIERKALDGDVALPAPKPLRKPREVLVERQPGSVRGFDPISENFGTFAVGTDVIEAPSDVATVDKYLDGIASAIASTGQSPVKTVRFSSHSAVEVRAMADGLQESILAKSERSRVDLSDFDINAIEVYTLSDGTVEMTLPSKSEAVLAPSAKKSYLNIKAPAQQVDAVREALRKVMAKPRQAIDNDFKWKRQLRMELDDVPGLDFNDIVTDLEHIYSIIFIIRDDYDPNGLYADIAA